MYSIIEGIIAGSNDIVTAICGVLLCVVFAEMVVMLFKVFRFFTK